MQVVHTLWPTEIYEKKCDLDLQTLWLRCQKHQQVKESIKISNWNGGYQGHDFVDPEFENLVLTCWPKNAQREQVSVRLQSWVNINGFGHWNTLHNHLDENCLLSGVFYVRCPVDSGDLLLYDPRYLSNVGAYHRYYGGNTGQYLSFTPQPNTLLFFPPSLFHMVGPNMSHDLRCSIAFNIMVASPNNNQ